MLNCVIDEKKVCVAVKNSLSFSDFNQLLKVSINGEEYSISKGDFSFFDGCFQLNNGLTFSKEDSKKIQGIYLEMESKLLNKDSVVFKLPSSKDDLSGGVALYNPYFQAMLNNLSRKIGFELIGFGSYLSEKEKKFAYEYNAFHPSSLSLVYGKLKLSNMNQRVVIKGHMLELILKQAMKHISGYRDVQRYQKFAENNGLDFNKEYVFLMEYNHILDADLKNELIDFQNKIGTGGFLDILDVDVALGGNQ